MKVNEQTIGLIYVGWVTHEVAGLVRTVRHYFFETLDGVDDNWLNFFNLRKNGYTKLTELKAELEKQIKEVQ